MNSDCEALQGYPAGWTLIGKPEEVEVKDYVTEWVPGENCEYATIGEAYEAYIGEHSDECGDIEEEDGTVYFPDDGFDPKKFGFVEKKTQTGTHTEIQYFYTDRDGKRRRCADSSRYKAIGNSIAVGYANNQSGFWMWLIKRISAQYERSATLGSLFDGISGFCLAWARYNGPENCLWASEIDPFCIAVCRQHFGDEETGEVGDIGKYL